VTAAFDGCTYGLYHLLEIPSMVGFTATPGMDGLPSLLFGLPEPPSFVTSILRGQGNGDSLGIWDRAVNFLEAVDGSLFYFRLAATQRLFNELYGEDFPTLREVGSRMTYLFLNTNEVLNVPKPISSKVKFIGGIAMKGPKPVTAVCGCLLFQDGHLISTICRNSTLCCRVRRRG